MQKDEIKNVQPHDGNALLNAVPGWIKVSDKMPEHNVGVLVFIPKEDFHITSGMWDISNKWVLLDEYRVPDCEVTHWMELPDMPQEFHKERDENNSIMAMLKEMEEPLRKAYEENERNRKNSVRYPHGR